MVAQSSVSSSRVSAFRRSGRLKVNTVICGDSFSTKTTGMLSTADYADFRAIVGRFCETPFLGGV
jgi:hypothetical protein